MPAAISSKNVAPVSSSWALSLCTPVSTSRETISSAPAQVWPTWKTYPFADDPANQRPVHPPIPRGKWASVVRLIERRVCIMSCFSRTDYTCVPHVRSDRNPCEVGASSMRAAAAVTVMGTDAVSATSSSPRRARSQSPPNAGCVTAATAEASRLRRRPCSICLCRRRL
jgi:hypothetical protein